MAFAFDDLVHETSTTTGTGTYTLDGAVAANRQSFVEGIGDTNTTVYVAVGAGDWEVGIGTVTDASDDTLSRDEIVASSNGGAAVDWSSGTRNIFCAPAAFLGQRLWDRQFFFGRAGGTADALTLTPDPSVQALSEGMVFFVQANAANTGAATLNVNGLGAKAIKKHHDDALVANDFLADGIYALVYQADDDIFEMISPASVSAAVLGANTFTGIQRWALGTAIDDDDVDGSNILTLPTDGNAFSFSGTQQVDEIATLGVGTTVKLIHASARTFAHDATDLILIGGQDIVTAAGDVSEWIEYATGDWRMTNFVQAGALNLQDRDLERPVIKDYGETVNDIGATGGGTQDIDLESGNVVTATVDTSTTTFTFSNPPASGTAGSFTLALTNGGSQTVNWPASVDWAGGTPPTLTTSGVDVLTFFTIDGGTTWFGFAAGLDMQ